MATLPEKRIPDDREQVKRCHECALSTAESLGDLVGQCEPGAVRQMKEIDGIHHAWRDCGEQIGKTIIRLRNEYVDWLEHRNTIARFDRFCYQSFEVLSFFGTDAHSANAHAVLDDIARAILDRIWGNVDPSKKHRRDWPPEERWPVDSSQMFQDSDLDQMAAAVTFSDLADANDVALDKRSVDRLAATMEQEYARYVESIPTVADSGKPKDDSADGPTGVDSFRYRGKPYAPLAKGPFAALSVVWKSEGRCANRQDLAEALYGDREEQLNESTLRDLRGKLNEFFRANSIPYKAIVRGYSIAVKDGAPPAARPVKRLRPGGKKKTRR